MASGGRRTTGGAYFQACVTAYYLARVLAEKGATPGFGLSSDTTLASVHSEVGEPVDDLMVVSSNGTRILAQVKRSVTRATIKGSPFYSVADQFARQYLLNRARGYALDGSTADRLLLVVGPGTNDSVAVHLRSALDAVRQSGPDGSLDALPVDSRGRAVFDQFVAHVKTAWQSAEGSLPSDTDLLKLLALARVVKLDVESEGRDALQAQDLLRQVVREPKDASRAWTDLVAHALQMAKSSSSIDLVGVQEVLANNGLELRAPRSFEDDVSALREVSHSHAELLRRHSTLKAPEGDVVVQRECVDTLLESARQTSVLLIGEPGAGKSGVLHQLHTRLVDDSADALVLLVDRLAATTPRELSVELGLKHDLVETLRSWPGSGPGFLLIDALDAARDAAVAQVVRDVVARVTLPGSRWHVVASVRKFDLRYSRELQRLFPGHIESAYRDQTFMDVRHLAVPLLSDAELDQVRNRSPSLSAVIEAQTTSLLTSPFNLQLLGEILSANSDIAVPSTLTETALLERYWQERVVEPVRTAVDRERTLKMLCDQLLEKRSLQGSTLDLDARAEDITALLTRGVLAEWQSGSSVDRHQLSFAHHRLFDFAIAQLLLWREPEALARRVDQDPDFAVIARPSVHILFDLLWENDRDRFWQETLAMLEQGRPTIAAIVGPHVLARRTSTLEELKPLTAGLSTNDERWVELLHHLIGSLLAEDASIAGEGADVWCEFAAYLSENLDVAVWATRVLVARAIEQHTALTKLQRLAINRAAAALLRFCWQTDPDRINSAIAIEALCKTFQGDPSATAELLTEVLTEKHLAERGFEEVPVFARHAHELYGQAPSLVAQLYRAAFGFEEESTENTSMGGGAIMSLVSHRAQDYRHSWWQLAEGFGRFVETAPEEATRALCAVAYETSKRENRDFTAERPSQEFQVQGRTCRYRADFSYVWHAPREGAYSEPRRMLDTFTVALRAAEKRGDDELVERFLNALIEHGEIAVLWERVLAIAAGARSDGPLVEFARQCCLHDVILTGLDTTVAVGDFLKAQFGGMSPEHRKDVERALVRLVEDPEPEPARARARDRLVGCLDAAHVVLPQTKQRLTELAALGGPPENKPLSRWTGLKSSKWTTRDYLEEQGVKVDDSVEQLLTAIQGVEKFTTRFANSAPTAKDSEAIAPALATLHSAVVIAEKADAPEDAIAVGWGALADVCAALARQEGLQCDSGFGATVRELLLEASTKPWPVFHAETDEHFERGASWGSPNARISAAAGVATLAARKACASDQVHCAVRRLAADDVAAVRYQVVARLVGMYANSPSIVWEIATERSTAEKNLGVLKTLLSRVLTPLCAPDGDRSLALALEVLAYARSRNADSFTAKALHLVTQLHVYRNNEVASGVVKDTVENLPKAANGLLTSFRAAAVFDDDSDEEQAKRVRLAALTLMRDVVVSALSAWRNLASKGPANWDEQERERAKDLQDLVQTICKEFYFASDALALEQQKEERRLTPAARKRYYEESHFLLDELVRVPFPSGAHDVIKTLKSYIDIDARGIFLGVATAVEAAQGYKMEWFGAQEVVKLVQLYLADHRDLLRVHDDCRQALVQLLNTFVSWPEARKLAYRLEEIFR